MEKEELLNKLTLRQKADLLTGKDFWSTQGYEELGIPSIFFRTGLTGSENRPPRPTISV